jgi:predicted RNA binding protein YcfA (HicA-like mRNA interferase family)
VAIRPPVARRPVVRIYVGPVARLLDQRRAIKLLQQHGWRRTVGGKHAVKMVRPGEIITLPRHQGQTYGKKLTHGILKQAGLESTEDQRWSSRSSSMKSAGVSGQRLPSSPDASRQPER